MHACTCKDNLIKSIDMQRKKDTGHDSKWVMSAWVSSTSGPPSPPSPFRYPQASPMVLRAYLYLYLYVSLSSSGDDGGVVALAGVPAEDTSRRPGWKWFYTVIVLHSAVTCGTAAVDPVRSAWSL